MVSKFSPTPIVTLSSYSPQCRLQGRLVLFFYSDLPYIHVVLTVVLRVAVSDDRNVPCQILRRREQYSVAYRDVPLLHALDRVQTETPSGFLSSMFQPFPITNIRQ